MKFNRTHRVVALFAITFVSLVQQGRAATSVLELKDALTANYPITKVGMAMLSINYNRITQPGIVLTVRIPGIYADVADTKQAIVATNIDGGQASQQKGFLASLSNSKQARQLNPKETVYVTKIDVKGDFVHFEIITENTTAISTFGSTQQERYRSEVVFRFPNGSLETMTPDDVKKAIDAVLYDGTVPVPVESKTIKIGMTGDDVKKSIGNPDKIVSLGEKQIYVYKDMKVIFKQDMVADVQ
jgi:hypothetical protein